MAAKLEPLVAREDWALWIVDLDRLMSPYSALGMLSEAERQRFAAIADPRRRARRLVCRAALRTVIAGMLDTEPAEVPLDAAGPPAVRSGGLSASVSHSGNVGVIGVCSAGSIGVDVELPRPGLDVGRFARRWFAASETAALSSLAPAAASDGLLRCWTTKEAIVKALGVPLAGHLDRIVVEPDPARPAAVLAVPAPWQRHRLSVTELCVLGGRARVAVCVDSAAGAQRGRHHGLHQPRENVVDVP